MTSDLSGKASRNHFLPLSKRQKRVEGGSPVRSRHIPNPQFKKPDVLIRASIRILEARNMEEMLREVAAAARELTDARQAKAANGYSDGRFSVDAHSHAENTEACAKTLSFAVNRGGVYLELIQRTPTLRLTARQLENHRQWWGLPAGHVPLRGLLGARITDARNQPCGMILVSDKVGGKEFTAEDEGLVERLAAFASTALQHLESRQEAEYDRQHFQAVLESIAEGVIGINPDGSLSAANPAAMAMFDADNEDIESISIPQFLQHFDVRTENGQSVEPNAFERVLVGERLSDFIAIIRNKQSHRSWTARFDGLPIMDSRGKVLFGVLTVNDITRDRQIRRSLRSTRDHLNSLLASIQDGVIALDKSWRFTYINDSAARIFDLSPDKVIGQMAWSALANFRQPMLQDEFKRVMREGHSVRFEAFDDKSGHWFECRCYPSPEGLTALFSDTTERRQLQEALYESEQRLQRVLAGSNDGYWEWDLKTDCVETSPRWLEIIGDGSGELTFDRKSIEDMIHPEDLSEIQEVIYGLKQPDRCITRREYECRIRHREGYYLHIHLRGKITLRDTKGRPLRVSGTITDISDRVRAQEMLRINEEIALERLTEIETIYKNAPVGLCVLDADLRFVRLNERFSMIAGIPVSGHIGRTMADVVPEIARVAEPVMQRVFSNGGPVSNIEIKGTSVSQPGKSRYWLSHFFPLRNAEDEIVGLNVVFEDITERKQAEEKARRRAAELEAIMDNVPAFVLISRDPEARNMTGNRATHELVHLPQGANLSFTGPEDQQPSQFRIYKDGKEIPFEDLPLQQAARKGRYIRDAEMDMVFVDGRSMTLFGNASPIFDDAGHSQGAVGAFIDITERKQVESQLKDLNTTLEHRVKERTSQLESVNADLKRRAGQLQVLALKLSEAEDKERRRLAELLHDDLQQLLAAAKLQVGQLSELSSGNQQIQQILEQVDRILTDSVRKTRNLSHELSPSVLSHEGLIAALKWMGRQMETKHGLSVDIVAEETAEPATHPLRVFFYKAASEILFNVVKHAGTGTAQMDIRRNADNIEMSISDNGEGFDPEKVQISGFDSGFGLFSIREHAKMLGGRLQIESTPGNGSRFLLSLPDTETGREAKQTGEPHAHGLMDTDRFCDRNRETIKVLVVDDHRMMRQGLSSMLSKQPDIVVVGQAENGKQAIDKVRQHHPDVVLMDVSMPVMNGIEATRQIKDQWPNTSVIALSMYDEPDIHVAMIEAGAATYLNKTGPSETLLSTVRDHSPAFSA